MLTPLYGSLGSLTLPRTSVAAGPSYDPLDLPWMVFYDASQGIAGSAAQGASVTNWSSVARNELSRTASPVFGNAPLKSEYADTPTLLLDGNTYLSPDYDGAQEVGDNFTIIAVYRKMGGNYIISKYNNSFSYEPDNAVFPKAGVVHELNTGYGGQNPYLRPLGQLNVATIRKNGDFISNRMNGNDWTHIVNTTPMENNGQPLRIGYESSFGGTPYQGHIAVLGVCRRALTDAEVIALENHYGANT